MGGCFSINGGVSENKIEVCSVPPQCIASGGFGCLIKANESTNDFINYLKENVYSIRVYNGDQGATSSITGSSPFLHKSITQEKISDFLEYIIQNVPSFKIMFIKQYKDKAGNNIDARQNAQFNEQKFLKEVTEIGRVINILDENETTIKYLNFNNNLKPQDKYFAINIDLKTSIEYMLKNGLNVTSNIYLICQDYCVDGDLFEQKDTVTFDDIINIYQDLTPVLTKLHKRSFIHNDIKQENIVKCGTKYKFIDFGLSCNLNGIDDKKLDECKRSGTSEYKIPCLNGEDYYRIKITIPQNMIQEEYRSIFVSTGNNLEINIENLAKYANNVCNNQENLKFKKNDEFALAVTLFICLWRCYGKATQDTLNVNQDKITQILQIIFDLCNPLKILSLPPPTPPLGGASKSTTTLKKTQERVTIKGAGSRIVYTGTHGKKYIKYKGQYTPLSELKKLLVK